MAVALDFIKGALRRINSYQSGEQIAQLDAQDALDTFNDLLDSWSLDKPIVFGTNENILQWTTGKTQYKVGNPTCTSLGQPTITGTVTGASPTITGVTSIPTNLAIGATLTDLANVIPSGTQVTAIGASTITMSANATSTPSSNPEAITYTIPGDLAIARPLRITGGFTRLNQLDFWMDVYASREEYTSILYKSQAGPWPTLAWYNNQMPYGILNVYQSPASNAELHLFTDTILSNLTLMQTVIVPQGYARAIKWCLAKELCAEYGFQMTEAIKKNSDDSLKLLKALNAQPAPRSKYDRALMPSHRPDGSWITHGGYR